MDKKNLEDLKDALRSFLAQQIDQSALSEVKEKLVENTAQQRQILEMARNHHITLWPGRP